VTLVDANHCPGAVQFLFSLPDGRRFVHTGDMRFCEAMLADAHLEAFRGADALYLDTTYADLRHDFPAQEESVEYVAETIARLMREDQAGAMDGPGGNSGGLEQQQHRLRRLFLISTYVIGKERILQAVHRRCGVPLCVTDRKLAVMSALAADGEEGRLEEAATAAIASIAAEGGEGEQQEVETGVAGGMFTTDASATPIHVVPWGVLGDTWPFFRPNFVNMRRLMEESGADEVVGFVPTGWVSEMKKSPFSLRSKGACHVHLVPYSEHSSCKELLRYVGYMRPHKVVPTVCPDPSSDGGRAQRKILALFRGLVDETASKAKFLAPFSTKQTVEGGEGEMAEGEMEAVADEQVAGSARAGAAAEDVVCSRDEKAGDCSGDDEGQVDGDGKTGSSSRGATASTAAGATDAEPRPNAPVDQLLVIVGGAISQGEAEELLVAAHGDLQLATNMHFDGSLRKAAMASQRAPGNEGSQRQAAARKGGASPQSRLAVPRSGGKKRKADAGLETNQRSILSFFGKGCAGDKAATLPQPSHQQQQQLVEPEAAATCQPLDPIPPPPPPAAAAAAVDQPRTLQAFAPSSLQPRPSDRASQVPTDAILLPLDAYNPVGHAPWTPGTPCPYLHLARTMEALNSTSKRLRIGDGLVNYFRYCSFCFVLPRIIWLLIFAPTGLGCFRLLFCIVCIQPCHFLSLFLPYLSCFWFTYCRSVAALSPQDLLPSALLVLGKVGPDHEGVEVNVGGAMVGQALEETTGVTRDKLRYVVEG
jgi:hypothetical protein